MFILQRVPKYFDSIFIGFAVFLNDIEWFHFRPLLLSLVLTPYKATLAGMDKVLAFGGHRSKHNEFLTRSSHVLAHLLQFWALLLVEALKKHGEPLYFILDDTSNKKRGKKCDAAFKFFEHCSKTYMVGHQIVCGVIRYRGLTIPVGLDVYVPKDQAESLGVSFRKKTQMAQDLLARFEFDEDQVVFVLADSFYATAPIMTHCRKRGYSFISVLKENRVFTIGKQKTNVRDYIHSQRNRFQKRHSVKIGNSRFQTVTQLARLKTGGEVKVVLSKRQSHKTVMAIFTTNTSLPLVSILEAYQKRWSIEVFFKMSKTYLGFKAYQNRNLGAIQSYLLLSMCAHNLLTHVFIEELRAQGKHLTEKNIAHFSIVGMRDHIRQIATIDAMEYCFDKSKSLTKEEAMHNLLQLSIAA